MRMSAVEFEKHVDCVRMEIAEILKKTNSVETVSIGEYIGKR